MKKTIILCAIGVFAMLNACGPSEEEIRQREQARQDSIAKVEEERAKAEAAERARQDSIRQVEEAAAAAEKARQDSIAAAEAKKNKPKPKPKEEPKDQPKVGKKRGA